MALNGTACSSSITLSPLPSRVLMYAYCYNIGRSVNLELLNTTAASMVIHRWELGRKRHQVTDGKVLALSKKGMRA